MIELFVYYFDSRFESEVDIKVYSLYEFLEIVCCVDKIILGVYDVLNNKAYAITPDRYSELIEMVKCDYGINLFCD